MVPLRNLEERFALQLWELRRLSDHYVPAFLARHSKAFSCLDTRRLMALMEGEDPRFAAIAERASELSGGEIEEDQSGSFPLRSVFSRLSVGEERASPVYYSPMPLTVDGIFPGGAGGDPSALLCEMDKELDRLDEKSPGDPDAFLVLLDTVFKKYLWCLPAGKGAEIDVSLYDRMKATAAIGLCLLDAESATPFVLLAADFSGIQNYIFSVARTGVKGVSKRLRARSFLVDVMVQSLAYELCARLDVPQTNIMMLTGGKFYLLLPNRPGLDRQLESIRDEVDKALFRRFYGDICVNMAWLSFDGGGLLDYSATVTELSRRLRENKQRPFRSVLIDGDQWQEDAAILVDDLANKRACPSCGRRLMKREREICLECEEQETLGGRLATAEQLWFSTEGKYRLWDFCGISFDRSGAKGRLIRVEQLNNWTLRKELLDAPLGVRLMANRLPKEGGEPLTFSDLAERATGTKRIAALKADVDNLGYLFADGMRQQDRHYGTISRVSALSRLLDMFFSGYVGHLLKTKYPMVYSVFSGGDDLFLIGPWDVMPSLAIDIHDAFGRLSGGNTCVTLSAAICAATAHANISLLAEHSEEVLKTVKNHAPQELYPDKQGRNGISFLGQTFSWEDFALQLKHVETLESARGSVNVSILRRIGQYSRMYQSFLRSHDVMQLMFEPLFHYDQMRNYSKLKSDAAAAFLDWARKLKSDAAQAANYRDIKRDLYFSDVVVTCYLNKTKEARNNGV